LVGCPGVLLGNTKTTERCLTVGIFNQYKDYKTKEVLIINKYIKRQSDNYLKLTAGECSVCDVCAVVEDEPCRFPDKAISSLEAYCMNVSTLAELCHIKYNIDFGL